MRSLMEILLTGSLAHNDLLYNNTCTHGVYDTEFEHEISFFEVLDMPQAFVPQISTQSLALYHRPNFNINSIHNVKPSD